MGDPVEFRVLGPLEVVVGGEPVRIGGPRPLQATVRLRQSPAAWFP